MPSELIEVADACRMILERAVPLAAEEVPLDDALGRALAKEVRSDGPVPRFDNSAMDGYAVRAKDTAGAGARSPRTLCLIGESRAGAPAALALGEGEAIAISTGAMLPEGADAVVRVDDTVARDSLVEVLVEIGEGRDLRRAGEDIRDGETVLRPGTVLGSAELGVLASIGCEAVPCARRPRVAIVVSGDELKPPGQPLGPGEIHDSNAHTLRALAQEAGADAGEVARVGDEPAAVRAALEASLGADLLVVSGGVSVGAHDHAKESLAELGAEQVFWGLALRPGRPTWFGTHPEGALVLGVPGNPVSAMVCFVLLARPAIMALQGADPGANRTTAILDRPYEKWPGRAHAVRCRLRLDADGWHATPTKDQGSHVLTSMLGADALALIPTASQAVAAGERVEIELLRPRGSA